MCYAVLGGDLRFAHLVSMLNESGRKAVGFFHGETGENEPALEELKRYSCIISNWPMRRTMSRTDVTDAEVFENISPGSMLLLCGPNFPRERRWDLQYVNLWEDEQLLQENAYLTAEAAVATAMRLTRPGLEGARVVVIGYGRIGKSLVSILHNLGANVTVISSKEGKRRQAEASGAIASAHEEIPLVLPCKEIIFSTPPAMLLDRAALEYVDKGALLIDLASPPYGIDLEAAQEFNLNVRRESNLPGRYCPLSAARAIFNALIRWEETGKNG